MRKIVVKILDVNNISKVDYCYFELNPNRMSSF